MRSPIVLQLFIFYALSMVFGYRGREVWRQLKKESFVEKVNPTTGKKRYIIDQSVMEKNYQLQPSSKELEITDDEEEATTSSSNNNSNNNNNNKKNVCYFP